MLAEKLSSSRFPSRNLYLVVAVGHEMLQMKFVFWFLVLRFTVSKTPEAMRVGMLLNWYSSMWSATSLWKSLAIWAGNARPLMPVRVAVF